MSRSHFIFRNVPMDAWVDRYEKSHQNPINRVFHTFGVPMIAVSISLFFIAPLVRGFLKIPLSSLAGITGLWLWLTILELRDSKTGELVMEYPQPGGEGRAARCNA